MLSLALALAAAVEAWKVKRITKGGWIWRYGLPWMVVGAAPVRSRQQRRPLAQVASHSRSRESTIAVSFLRWIACDLQLADGSLADSDGPSPPASPGQLLVVERDDDGDDDDEDCNYITQSALACA